MQSEHSLFHNEAPWWVSPFTCSRTGLVVTGICTMLLTQMVESCFELFLGIQSACLLSFVGNAVRCRTSHGQIRQSTPTWEGHDLQLLWVDGHLRDHHHPETACAVHVAAWTDATNHACPCCNSALVPPPCTQLAGCMCLKHSLD